LKIPDSLRVGGVYYRILCNKDSDFELGHDLDGDFNEDKARIRLRSTVLPARLSEIFIHEIIHAVDCVYGAGQELTENQTIGLTHGLYQVLSDMGIGFTL